jgi:transposase
MQGKKEYNEKLFVSFQLSQRVPESNFYRRLNDLLDLSYLRDITKEYYGLEGQKSIDPVVFFKLMLVGYLENINSDRQIINQSSLRLDILYFLGYDLDEPLPWHSTLSRTRKLFGEEVFLELFRSILRSCVDRGMVSGRSQAIDSAFIKANASMDSIVERELYDCSKQYFDDITENEENSNTNKNGTKKKDNPEPKYNEKYVSVSDPDARVSQKKGKPPLLNHLGIISVDTESHIICGAAVDFANKRDFMTTELIVGQTIENLKENDIKIEEILADGGYSGPESYKYLESQNIIAHIPCPGSYKPQRDGFTYNKEEDCYVCNKGVKLHFRGLKYHKHTKSPQKIYRSKTKDCKDCSCKAQCCKSSFKQLEDSSFKTYYDAAYNRMNTKQGKQKKYLRSATVEPVWGTLLNFIKMKKVYTKGNVLAHKQLLMAATAYNIKKLMKFVSPKSIVNQAKQTFIRFKNDFSNTLDRFEDALRGIMGIFCLCRICRV